MLFLSGKRRHARCLPLSQAAPACVSLERDLFRSVRYPARAMRTDDNAPELAAAGGDGGTIVVDAGPVVEVKARGYWEQVWLRFRQDRVAIAGGVFIVVLLLAAFIGGPIAAQILGHGPDHIFANGVDMNTLQPVGPLTTISTAPVPDARRDGGLRGHVPDPRCGRAARARHVPAHPLRGADLARGRRVRDDLRRLGRRPARPSRRLLPGHGGHRRVPPDRDRDGVPGAPVHHRRVRHGRVRS